MLVLIVITRMSVGLYSRVQEVINHFLPRKRDFSVWPATANSKT